MRTVHSPSIHLEPKIYSIEQFHGALEREKARAERNGHGISLVIIQTSDPDRRAGQGPVVTDVLKGRLRVMDEAGWFDQSHLGVLMPYTSRDGAWHLAEDICRLTDGALVRSDCRVYTYPHDWFGRDDGDGRPGTTDERRSPTAAPRVDASIDAGGVPAACCRIASREETGSDLPGGTLACDCPFEPQAETGAPAWQRVLDIVGALLGLLVLSPLFLLTALVIKTVSPGPVFFKQERVGRGGRPFLLWKFRTMKVNADTELHQKYVAELIRNANRGAAGKPMNKLKDDPRVIPFGVFLRGSCIDELPQLFNVLRGEMSLVGPRPPLPYEAQEYLPWQRRRFDTMPGLTGLWQVSGKNRLTFEEMIRLDIRYCRTKCLWRAIAIICRTPLAIAQEIAYARVHWKMKMGVSENG